MRRWRTIICTISNSTKACAAASLHDAPVFIFLHFFESKLLRQPESKRIGSYGELIKLLLRWSCGRLGRRAARASPAGCCHVRCRPFALEPAHNRTAPRRPLAARSYLIYLYSAYTTGTAATQSHTTPQRTFAAIW